MNMIVRNAGSGALLRLLPDFENLDKGFLRVQWCFVDGDAVQRKVRDIRHPVILLVVRDEKHNEQRAIAPLEHYDALVPAFRSAGLHEVYGFLMSRYEAEECVGTDRRNQFKVRIFRTDEEGGDVAHPLLSEMNDYAQDRLDVVVEKSVFSSTPRWVRRWVDWPYPTASRDECQLRKRIPIAFTLQPVVVALIGIVMAVFALLCRLPFAVINTLVFARRDVSWKNALLYGPILDKAGEMGSFLAYDSSGQRRRYADALVWLTPGVWLVAGGVVGGITYGGVTTVQKYGTTNTVLGVTALVLVVTLLLFVAFVKENGVRAVPVLGDMIKDREKRSWDREKTERIAREERQMALVASLVCDGSGPPPIPVPTWTQLPHRIYTDVKLKVCKPFAE